MTTKFGGFALSADIDKSKAAAKKRKGFMRKILSRAREVGNGGIDRNRFRVET